MEYIVIIQLPLKYLHTFTVLIDMPTHYFPEKELLTQGWKLFISTN